MIQNNGRTIAQARWVPADTVPIGIDPITIALAVAMMRIDKKMDEIQDTQEEILHFLQNDKESKIEGEINSLASVLDRYQFNSDNERWCGGQLTVVSNINVNAESSIRFYRKQIIDLLDKQKKIHSERDSRKLIAGVQRAIQYYKLSVYLHAYSAFLEVVLGNNFTKDYIDHILTTLDENAMQFREDYSKCHIVLENYAGSTVQTKVLSSMGSTSKAIGKVISKIPVISKGPIDEVLIAAGEQVIQSSSDKPEKAMKRFQESKDPGIQVFVDALQSMNQICNDPVELFFDEEMLYVCA